MSVRHTMPVFRVELTIRTLYVSSGFFCWVLAGWLLGPRCRVHFAFLLLFWVVFGGGGLGGGGGGEGGGGGGEGGGVGGRGWGGGGWGGWGGTHVHIAECHV